MKYSALDHPDGSGRALFELVPGSAAGARAHVVTDAGQQYTTASTLADQLGVADEWQHGNSCRNGDTSHGRWSHSHAA